MTDEIPSWQQVLLTWDVEAEQEKADFLEYLYQICKPEDHTYTGLYRAYCEAAPDILKRIIMENLSVDSSASDDTNSDDRTQQPICDV